MAYEKHREKTQAIDGNSSIKRTTIMQYEITATMSLHNKLNNGKTATRSVIERSE